ncbi:hypothetical protein TrVE_jg6582 [Triparma verrucosa]|uniref:Uncharacterized protein n=1 Tax=Triparma verrucosa TaxID=1606542 RepID=A0A9W7C1A7_9STRA|nr:hypothetical protein TrVE_jg6582 [Triparma verrucosa]
MCKILSYIPARRAQVILGMLLLCNKSLEHDVKLFYKSPFYRHLMMLRVKRATSKADPIAYPREVCRRRRRSNSGWVLIPAEMGECEQSTLIGIYMFGYFLTFGCCCHGCSPCYNWDRRRRNRRRVVGS